MVHTAWGTSETALSPPRSPSRPLSTSYNRLYILRRAFYSAAAANNDELEEFDLGKNRTIHAAHCFDYLTQTITCSVDTTVEPYEADEKTDGFLGSGFPRVCRDFDALKQYVEGHRVFNATGFLAVGIEHGKAHVHGDK
ncbi:hypothetical protein F4825DRAFT_388865 [Nemania diffusa]|nr:hypothetical protein F4825DRAFT_388865 [Nemania diffusa]